MLNDVTLKQVEQALKYLESDEQKIPLELKNLTDLEWVAMKVLSSQIKIQREESSLH
jgi:hypothetical protein